jgi:hypothetical protein
MADPRLYERNLETGYWQNINTDGSRGSDTDRRTEPGHSSNINRKYEDTYMGPGGGGRKSRRNARSRRNSKKSKRVRHTRLKQTRRHRHSRRR